MTASMTQTGGDTERRGAELRATALYLGARNHGSGLMHEVLQPGPPCVLDTWLRVHVQLFGGGRLKSGLLRYHAGAFANVPCRGLRQVKSRAAQLANNGRP